MDGFSRDDPSATPHPADLKQPTDLPTALADLRASGWESVSVAEEMRRNTAKAIAAGHSLVPGVLGFEDTVVPFDDRVYARETAEALAGRIPKRDYASRH